MYLHSTKMPRSRLYKHPLPRSGLDKDGFQTANSKTATNVSFTLDCRFDIVAINWNLNVLLLAKHRALCEEYWAHRADH